MQHLLKKEEGCPLILWGAKSAANQDKTGAGGKEFCSLRCIKAPGAAGTM